MKALLFVDMLGVKARWLKRGKTGAELAFKVFADQVAEAAKTTRELQSGCVEADSAALVFANGEGAICFARTLYFNAFFATKTDKHERIWLRGAILPAGNDGVLRQSQELPGGITSYTYSDRLLEAIHVEKSGFKGMRMVIDKDILDGDVRAQFTARFEDKSFYPFKKLAYAPLPEAIAMRYEEFLWMASGTPLQWKKAGLSMANRLRWCSPELGEEFTHAAATQVVFNECTALMMSRPIQGTVITR